MTQLDLLGVMCVQTAELECQMTISHTHRNGVDRSIWWVIESMR